MSFNINLPLCRATDPIESFMAADQAADLIKSHERLIVAALEQHGPGGVDSIARLCKLTGRSVKSDAGRSQREWKVAL